MTTKKIKLATWTPTRVEKFEDWIERMRVLPDHEFKDLQWTMHHVLRTGVPQTDLWERLLESDRTKRFWLPKLKESPPEWWDRLTAAQETQIMRCFFVHFSAVAATEDVEWHF